MFLPAFAIAHRFRLISVCKSAPFREINAARGAFFQHSTFHRESKTYPKKLRGAAETAPRCFHPISAFTNASALTATARTTPNAAPSAIRLILPSLFIISSFLSENSVLVLYGFIIAEQMSHKTDFAAGKTKFSDIRCFFRKQKRQIRLSEIRICPDFCYAAIPPAALRRLYASIVRRGSGILRG